MLIEPARLLTISDRPFRRVLELVTGSPPDFVLVSQTMRHPPHPEFVVPPLPPGADLLVRRSSYVHRGFVLSRHVSFVAESALPAYMAAALRKDIADLRDVAAKEDVRKVDFSFGTAGSETGIEEAILEVSGPDGFADDFVWRRYVGVLGETPAFVVVEALPAEFPGGIGEKSA